MGRNSNNTAGWPENMKSYQIVQETPTPDFMFWIPHPVCLRSCRTNCTVPTVALSNFLKRRTCMVLPKGGHSLPTNHTHKLIEPRTHTHIVHLENLLLLNRSKRNEYQYLFLTQLKQLDVLKVPLFQKYKGNLSWSVYFCPLIAISSSFLLAKSFLYMTVNSSVKLGFCYNMWISKQVWHKLVLDGGCPAQMLYSPTQSRTSDHPKSVS